MKAPTIMELIIAVIAIMTYIQVSFVPPLDPVCTGIAEPTALCDTDSDCEEKFPHTEI